VEILWGSRRLECVRSFCQIQRLRYDHEFSLTVEAEEDLMDLEVLKFVLQIPVENAIAHALKDKDGDGHIRIGCRREGAMIAFSIEDDGPGYAELPPAGGTGGGVLLRRSFSGGRVCSRFGGAGRNRVRP